MGILCCACRQGRPCSRNRRRLCRQSWRKGETRQGTGTHSRPRRQRLKWRLQWNAKTAGLHENSQRRFALQPCKQSEFPLVYYLRWKTQMRTGSVIGSRITSCIQKKIVSKWGFGKTGKNDVPTVGSLPKSLHLAFARRKGNTNWA